MEKRESIEEEIRIRPLGKCGRRSGVREWRESFAQEFGVID